MVEKTTIKIEPVALAMLRKKFVEVTTGKLIATDSLRALREFLESDFSCAVDIIVNLIMQWAVANSRSAKREKVSKQDVERAIVQVAEMRIQLKDYMDKTCV